MLLQPVDPSYVPEIWPIVKPLINKALISTAVNPTVMISREYVESEVLSGNCFLWIAHDGEEIWAAIVMKIMDDICDLVACGGSRLKDFLPQWSAMEQFARERGCKKIVAYGRPGWRRVLDGYRTKMAVIEKRLSD